MIREVFTAKACKFNSYFFQLSDPDRDPVVGLRPELRDAPLLTDRHQVPDDVSKTPQLGSDGGDVGDDDGSVRN